MINPHQNVKEKTVPSSAHSNRWALDFWLNRVSRHGQTDYIESF
jgi:hypothetical protein